MVAANLTIPDPFVAETIGTAGFDFMIIDMQHAPLTIDGVQTILIGLKAAGCPAIVRVPANDPTVIGQVLDVGADGIIVPMVNTAFDVEAAVAAAKYPPMGRRSWGPRRAVRISGGSQPYAATANDEVVVIAQIETADALANIEGILEVDGCDAVMIGPADLAQSMGLTIGTTDVRFQQATDQVLEACKRKGVAFGYFTGTANVAKDWAARGASITTLAGDVSFMLDGATRALELFREPSDERFPSVVGT